jgi:protein-S-isoprenylcysteine O-methyltransferase Ste14
MHVNRFFSSVVRIQRERGHALVTTGPYRWVRHPGYAAAIPAAVASGLALGSWISAAVGALGVPLILWRMVGEERTLRAELPGYAGYARRVRWRLLPGVW